MSEYYVQVGRRLREAREGRRLSRRQVVEEMKRRGYRLSISSLQDFEEGKRLNLDSVLQLAMVLRRPPAWILGFGTADDPDVEELETLVRRSSHLSPLERELLMAAIHHIHRLREEGRAEAAPASVRPADASPASVRQAALAILGQGGAYAARELARRPELASVPETLVHRVLQELRREGVVEAVGARPVRYALASAPPFEEEERQA